MSATDAIIFGGRFMKKTKVFRIYPPFGYKFSDGQGISSANEKEVLRTVLSLSDDPRWLRNVALDNHSGRLKVLRQNGFQFI